MEQEQKYFITYKNFPSGERKIYMNRTEFSLSNVEKEIDLLEKQQEEYIKNKFGRTRFSFEYHLILKSV